MKYIRTKDGRIVEEGKLEPELKQTCITLVRKRDNKTLRQIICDDMDEYVEMLVVGEYCKCHKINPKDIRYDRIVLLNEILKQADAIEELCDEFIVENPEKDIHERCCDLQDVFDWVDDQEIPIGIKDFDEKRDLISGKHDWKVYGAIWTDKGLIYVAKMNDEGDLKLL